MSSIRPALCVALLLGAGALPGCGGKKGTLTISIATPVDVDPFLAGATVHLTVGSPAFAEQTAAVSNGHFSLDLSIKPPSGTTLVGPVVLEVLDASGKVVARGRSPDIAFQPLDETVTVWVGPVARTAVARGTLVKPRRSPLAERLPGIGAIFVGGATNGGDGGVSADSDAEVWNAYTLSSFAVTSLPQGRAAATLIAVDASGSGTVLIAGGGTPPEAGLLGFDTSVNLGAWPQLATDPSLARRWAAATRLSDGTTLIVGGVGTQDQSLDTAVVVATAGSTTVTPVAARLATTRVFHTVTAAKVPGGEGAIIVGGSPDGSGAEVYSTAARTFAPSPIDAKLLPGLGHSASGLASGKVLVAGGQTGMPASPTADGLVIDAAAGSATPVPGLLSAARSGHSATVVGTTLLVCGGEDKGGNDLDSCDVVDISSDIPKRTSTFRMAVPRSGHRAVLLPQGTVLLVGGDSPAAQSTVEIYTP